MNPGSTVICARSITRAPFACPCTWASGPSALIRSPSIRMPTPACGASDRPSISRPALMRTAGAGWASRGACAGAVVATASVANRAKQGRIAVSLRGEPNLPVTVPMSRHTFGTIPNTVRDRAGRTMALLWKNYLYNIVRKRWYVKAPDGTTLYVAKEDSIILSLLRRFLGPLFGLVGSSAGQLPGVVRGRDGLRARVRLRTDGHRVLHERPCGLAPLRRPVARAVGRCIGRDLRGGGGSGGGLVPPPRALLLAGQTDRLRAAGVGGVSDLNGPAESLHRQLRTPRRPRRRREHRLAAGAEPAVETVQALD